ncbi:TIGR04255 family protein [Paracraurococcus lichenis]|uniref:TIGR04255 family protein n=1 Tax=Paracraurococcus lichenis TaxID=3064888 RepID=A0ABT9E5A5_9PROT|nr:TIGR04255 family protein [Paracraurococcus sp. LOR1-02]MDO9711323.1 TIGR04255 family protein [Paracraurococcus sp. LOR1-02]
MTQSEGQFEPLHEGHAIDHVLFAVQFARPLPEGAFSRAEMQRLHNRVRKMLPRGGEEQSIDVTVPNLTLDQPAATKASISAFFFDRVRPDGHPGIQLRVERQLITLRHTQYSRWDAVTREVYRLLEEACALFTTSQIPPVSVGLTYLDTFVWMHSDGPPRVSELLQPPGRSQWIAPVVYNTQEQWHSHAGVFQRLDDHVRRLVNVNLDDVHLQTPEGEQRRGISVAIVLTDAINQSGYIPTEVDPRDAYKWARIRFEMLHSENKRLMGEVISEAIAARINLGGASE